MTSSTPAGPAENEDQTQGGVSAAYAVVCAHDGVALVHASDEARGVSVDPRQAALLRVGESYRITTSAPTEQTFSLLTFRARAVAAFETPDRGLLRRLTKARPPVPIPWPPKLLLDTLLLRRGGCPADAHAALRLLADALRTFEAQRGLQQRPRPRAGPAHRQLVEAAKATIAAAPGRPHLLGDLARALGASPFHLAHVFQAEAAIPLHRFVVDLRLARALAELGAGKAHLSTLALRLGFATHSHFTAAFRAAFGLPPSRVRRLLAESAGRALSGDSQSVSTGEGPDWLRVLRVAGEAGSLQLDWSGGAL